MATSIYENELRELLAEQITVLGTDLEILDKEAYVPHSIGTRSFIDLLAKDSSNHFVLIEIKRSNPAAREAIHEVLKYVEGVKDHLGAKEEEIRVIIASTEWRELYVPYSRFVKDSTLSVQGFELTVDDGKLNAEPVLPLPISMGRYIAPWHELNFYHDTASLEKGIKEYEVSYPQKGVENFVMLVLKAPEQSSQPSQVQLQQAGLRLVRYGQEPTSEAMAQYAKQMPSYTYILYVGMQILSKEECLALLEQGGQLNEVLEFLPEMEQEEEEEVVLTSLHEYWHAMEPRAHNDYYRIGYAAKLKGTLLQDEGWEILQTKRYGKFAANTLLSDDDILNELCGYTGSTGQSFRASINVAHKAQLNAARVASKKALTNNPVWSANIARILDEIEQEYPQQRFDINVYNPSSGITTLFLTATREDGYMYIPQYSMLIEQDDEKILYFGALIPEGGVASFNELIEKYYDGELLALLMTLTRGGYESRDSQILEDCGLVYRSFKCITKQHQQEAYALRNERWQRIEAFFPFEPFCSYLNAQNDLIESLVEEIGSRWDGSAFNYENQS